MTKIRLFYTPATGQWLHRIDGNSPMTEEEAIETAAKGFKLPAADIATIETDATSEEMDALRLASDWATVDGLPKPSLISTGLLIRPVPPPVELTPDERLVQAIESATALPQLKNALLERFRSKESQTHVEM